MPTHTRIFMIILAVSLWVTGCRESIEPGAGKPAQTHSIQARVAVAGIRQEPAYYEATGTVVARMSTTISSKIMGVIQTIHVQESDPITKGQILADIDPRQVNAGFLQAEAALSEARQAESAAVAARNAAQASADLTKATYDRYVNLMKTGSASRQEFDEVNARFQQAKASLNQSRAMIEASRSRVQQATAAVASARLSEADSRILAPYDGIVTAKLADAGSLASPGSPILRLESSQGFRVDMILPESHIQSIRPSQTVSVMIPSAGTPALEGIIQVIVPSADSASRSFTVQVGIPDHPGLHPGMFCRVRIPQKNMDKLLIPSTAILHQGQLTGIFLLDHEDIARFRILRVGQASEALTEILSGLKTGDRFVISPPPDLADGIRVEVQS